jgi:hypothetical protein
MKNQPILAATMLAALLLALSPASAEAYGGGGHSGSGGHSGGGGHGGGFGGHGGGFGGHGGGFGGHGGGFGGHGGGWAAHGGWTGHGGGWTGHGGGWAGHGTGWAGSGGGWNGHGWNGGRWNGRGWGGRGWGGWGWPWWPAWGVSYPLAGAYGYPYYDSSPVYEDAPDATPPAPAPPSYWYYCPSAGGYYPYVQQCPEPWVPVAPNPPG